jgi:uncharacterized membrane protein
MTGSEDWELTELRKLDPALRDAPPAPGSVRYDTILERAMSLQTPDTNTHTNTQTQRPRRSRRWMTWAAAGTGVAASVLTTVVVLGGHSTSASAAVLTAAEHTEKVVTLRGTTQEEIKTGGASTSTIEANGADMKIVEQDDIGTINTTIVGGIAYESTSDSDGTPHKNTGPNEHGLAPFAEATGNVARAALEGADVTDKGTEQVRGADTTHYQVKLTAESRRALAALPAGQTAWFEVEHPDQITSIDIWTAGDLIRRITVDQPERRTTTEYYDFGQPVTITKPAGF